MWKIEPKVKKFKVSQIFKGVIYFEIVLFFGSFWLYRKLCREQNFRYYCHQNCSFILEAFYKFLETVGHDNYRENDYKKWNIYIESDKSGVNNTDKTK